MADRTIGSLPAAATVDDGCLFVVEQQGTAMSATGAQWKGYAQAAVSQYVEEAQAVAQGVSGSVEAAAQSAAEAAESAADAAESAAHAEQYSGKPPTIIDGTWWIWNADIQAYEDTGEAVRGNVMYATFEIDPDTGLLTMTTPDEYNGPVFALVDGFLEVQI